MADATATPTATPTTGTGNQASSNGIDPTVFANQTPEERQAYLRSIWGTPYTTTGAGASGATTSSGSAGVPSNPGTGTTGTTGSPNTSLASQMNQAITNPINPYSTGEKVNVQTPGGDSITAPVQNGKSYMSSSELANAGIQFTKDPNTKVITINGHAINPVGYDKQGNPIYPFRASLNAYGVTDDNIKWDPKTDNVTYQLPQKQEQPQQTGYQSPLPGLMQSMPQMPQLQSYTPGDINAYFNSLPQLQAFNPNWDNYYQQGYNQTTPLVQNQIGTLENKQAMDITKADEGLNAKGIFNSGIAVQAENQIRANTNDQVAKVLMTQQANVAKIAQSLYMDAFKAWQSGNSDQLKQNQMALNSFIQTEKMRFDTWSRQQGLTLQQYQYASQQWDKVAGMALQDAQFQAKQQLDYEKMMQPYTMGPTPAQMLPYQYQTANNAADNQMKYAQMMGFDSSGRPTLDTFKALGYVQMPDGSLKPTLQATTDQQNYALNMAKAMGYMVMPDGSIKYTEQANHDRATEQNAQDANKLKLYDMMGFDQNGTPTLKRAEFQQKTQYDDQMLQNARQNAATQQNKDAIDALGKQLTAVDGEMNSIWNTVQNGKFTPEQQSAYQSLQTKKNGILQQLSQYAPGVFYPNNPSNNIDVTTTDNAAARGFH